MGSYPIFPAGIFRSWPVKRTPHFATRLQRGIAGRELRIADQPMPIWEWEVVHEILRDGWDIRGEPGPGTGYNDLRTLMGFVTQLLGSYSPFVFYDNSDGVVVDQLMGTGDGTTVNFPFLRQLTSGGLNEYLNGVSLFNDSALNTALGFTVPIPLIYWSGVLKTYGVDYTFYNTFQDFDPQWGSGVTFTTPPSALTPVTGTYYYLWICRLSEDSAEFENFSWQRWTQTGLKFRSLL